MKKYRDLSLWSIMAAKGQAVPAGSARWYCSDHSVLGKYTQKQCERMQTRIWAMIHGHQSIQ
jgi:hypothetical protein